MCLDKEGDYVEKNVCVIEDFMKLNIFEIIYALVLDCTSYVGEKSKAVINDPLSLTTLHYHIFICSSRCAAYVKSDQRRIEIFLQVLCVANKCNIDFSVLSNYGQYAQTDVPVFGYMKSFL